MAIVIYIIRKFILLLLRTGIVSFGKDRMYVVHTQVLLDGKKVIHEFPTEIPATSRRAAKKRIRQEVSFSTGTEAVGGKWIDRYREFYVQLYVNYRGRKVHSFAVCVMAKKRREAKFNITKRLSCKMGATALKQDLKKHA